MSQELNFKTLQSLISAAQRYENHSDHGRAKVKQELSTWQPTDANFIQPATKKPDFGTQGKSSSKPRYAGNFRNKTRSGQLRNISGHTYPSVGRVVVIKVNHKVEVTQQIRFAFILIVMSPQPVSCPVIYVVIVVSINA